MIDLHSHSNFSPDSKSNPEDNIKAAISKNLKFISFTDHIDKFCKQAPKDSIFDIGKYFDKLTYLKEKYKGKIEILIGLELGLSCENYESCNKIIDNNNFDFVIGSIHSVSYADIYSNRDKYTDNMELFYTDYYSYMLESIKKITSFNILGHIDYLDRYIPDKSLIPEFDIYGDLVDEILKEIIRTNRGIEYNTAGFRYDLGHANPKNEILKRYYDLKGRIITIGSDAHRPEDVGHMNIDAITNLKAIGFKEISYYKNKKLNFLSI